MTFAVLMEIHLALLLFIRTFGFLFGD